jgi:hypothetical protein
MWCAQIAVYEPFFDEADLNIMIRPYYRRSFEAKEEKKGEYGYSSIGLAELGATL